MRSTFMGLETARRGMTVQQYALETTGNNIANANTPGYSRQRVNFEAAEPYPPLGINRPQVPGQMGTGVKAGSVERVRESFLDVQFRSENNKSGYWSSRAEALSRLEDIMNEPSDAGLAKTLDRFWQSLEDLAASPNDPGARSVVRERGIAVADTFNYLSNSITALQKNTVQEIDVTIKEINSIATQLNNLNQQIRGIEPHGYLPNDLYDERDRLLDRLSELVDIEVTYEPNRGNALPTAEGNVTVSIVDSEGNSHTLVDGKDMTTSSLTVDNDNKVKIGADDLPLNYEKGKLSALLKAHDDYGKMIDNLDEMAHAFVTEFNEIHKKGWSLSDIKAGSHTERNFFEELKDVSGAAKNIKVDQAIIDSRDNIAAATDPNSGEEGNGENALLLAEVKNKVLDKIGSEEKTTLQGFYQGVIGEMAVKAQEANRMKSNTETLKISADQRRQSISGILLDEEIINLIRFQQAYNASARMVTVVDQLLEKIINGMGVVGR
ncbi:flagellar hook-associated protein FlgK [Pueribacillus theae]|uniref:Flagellar hook-associated protein 1 n=1 Tax=Pueribacillus theae TaxID=2171751 RepID=A0A2U1K546_9BACI|nr:flagellar hook-associated protein FlgK [Pueribacillus theae]PWA12627.1 flagellar hook-associated protein FlgK [Pueribacillus theae]